MLVLIGCVLAFLTRDLDPKFGEAKQLGFAVYNIAFTGIIIVVILQVVDMDQSGKLILQAIGVLWGSLFSAFAFVLPRLIEVVQSEKAKRRREPWMADASGDILKMSNAPSAAGNKASSWRASTGGHRRGESMPTISTESSLRATKTPVTGGGGLQSVVEEPQASAVDEHYALSEYASSSHGADADLVESQATRQ